MCLILSYQNIATLTPVYPFSIKVKEKKGNWEWDEVKQGKILILKNN